MYSEKEREKLKGLGFVNRKLVSGLSQVKEKEKKERKKEKRRKKKRTVERDICV